MANLVWCYEHRQWEGADDPYDFPISNTFRNAFIATGRMPNYGMVDLGPPPLDIPEAPQETEVVAPIPTPAPKPRIFPRQMGRTAPPSKPGRGFVNV